MKSIFIYIVLVLLVQAHLLTAQQEASGASTKALKYHQVLVKRPNSGYLFDRFFGSWLEGSTVESLETFLEEKSNAAEAKTGDHLLLAFFYAKQGEDAKALNVFEKALAQDSGNAEAWFEKAKAEARTLDFEAALADLDKAAAAEPKEDLELAIGKLKGRLLARNNKNDEALKVWRSLMMARPDDVELREDVIELLSDEGLYDEAIEVAKALVKKTSDPYQKIQRQLLTGDLQQRAGSREEALETYGSSLAQTGHGTWIEREILSQIDRMFRREDDIEGLEAFFSSLLKKEGKRIALRQRKAALLGELGEEEASIKEWKEILELTPGELPVREAFVAALSQMKRDEEAVKQMQSLVELSPDDGESLVRLAQLQWAADDAEGAGKTVNQYLEKSAGDEYAYLRAAVLLQTFSLEKETEAVFQKMLELYPESVGAREAFAGFLFELKRKDEALAIWEKLASEGDASQVVRTGRTLISRGQFGPAFDILKSRYDELKSDVVYLAQLTDAALRAKQTEGAFPWVHRRVILANTAKDLTEATGQALLLARRTGAAEEYLEELRKNGDKLSPQEECLAAELLNHMGDTKGAGELLSKIEGEGKVFALAEQARLHRLQKNWAGAAEAMRLSVELPGGRKTSNVQELVDLYQQGGELEKALKWIDEWKKLSPGSAAPWMRQAKALLDSGKVDESLQTLRTAARRFEDNIEVRVKLADTFVETGKTRDAVQIYWRLYDDAEDALQKMSWVAKLGKIASESGRTNLLVERFQERKRQNRNSIVPLLALAEIYRVADRYEERRQVILEAARLQPKDVALLHQLASIDEQEGKLDNARKSLRTALEFDKTGRTHQRLARLYFLTADYEKGFEVLQEAGGKGKDAKAKPELLEEVYNSIIQGGEWERAAAFLERFLAERPDDYRLHYLYAVAMEESEQYERAMDAFQQLLAFDKELPPRTNANPNQYPGYNRGQTAAQKKITERENELLNYPDTVKDMLSLMNHQYLAYHYREGRGEGRIYGFDLQGRGWSGYGYNYGQHVSPPALLEQVRFVVLAHLAKLSEKTDSGKLDSIFKEHGISEVHMEWQKRLNAAEKAGEKDRGKVFTAWIKDDPDNEVLHALWVQRWYGTSLELDQAEATMNYYTDKNPSLAVLASLIVVSHPWKSEEEKKRARAMIAKGLELAKTIDPVPFTVFQSAVSRAAKPSPNRGQAVSLLNDEQRLALRELAVKWQPEISKRTKGVWSDWASVSLLRLMVDDEDISPLLEALDKEVDRYREAQKGGASTTTNQQLQAKLQSLQQNMQLPALTIPPIGMPDISPTAVSFFAGPGRSTMAYFYVDDTWATKEKREQIKDKAAQIKDPVLRALAARFSGHKELESKTVQELIESDLPTASGLMLAAALLMDEKRDAESKAIAAGLLEKARLLNVPPLTMWVIDGALVNMALESEKGSKVHNYGKAAMKRLQGSIKLTRSYQMQQMAEALRQLGMEKEAARLALSATQSQNTTRSTGSAIGRAMDPAALSSKLQQLIKRGKRDVAIRTAAKQLKPIASGMLGQRGSALDYTLRELRRTIKTSNMEVEILKEADPGKKAKLVERVQFGALCEALEAKDQAKEIYEAVLAERPNDDNLRVRLVILNAVDDREAALAHLKKIKNKISLELILEPVSQSMQSASSVSERYDLAETALLILQNYKSAEGRNQGMWWENIRSNLARQSYNGSLRVPALTTRWDIEELKKSSSFNEADFNEAVKRRRELHDGICEAMLKSDVQGLAPIGFAWLNVTRAEEGLDPGKITEQAREVVSRMKQAAFISNNYTVGAVNSSWGYGTTPKKDMLVMGPIEWLVNEAWKSGNRDMIYKDILPEIEKDSERLNLAKSFRAYADLYFCDENKFGEAMDEMEKSMVNWGGMRMALSPIAEAYRKRELKFDLSPTINKLIDDSRADPYGMAYTVPNLLCLGPKKERSERMQGVLAKLAEKWLGPEEGRQVLLERHYQASRGGSGIHNQNIQLMEQFLNQCGEHAETLFPALTFVQEQGMEGSNSLYQLYRSFQSNNIFSKDTENGLTLLKESSLVEPLEQLKPMFMSDFPQMRNPKTLTLLGNMWGQLRDLNEKERVPYQEWIAGIPDPKPMGIQLILAGWEKKERCDVAAGIFSQFEKRIKALPEEGQLAMASLAIDVIKGEHLTDAVDAKARENWNWLQATAKKASGDETLKYLEAKNLAILGIEYYNLDNHALKLIQSQIETDVAKAVKIFGKTLELVEVERKARRWRQNYYRGETFGQRLMSKVVRKTSPEKALEFESRILRSKDIPDVTAIVWGASSDMARKLVKGWNPGEDDPNIDIFTQAFTKIGEALNETEPLALAGPVFFNMLNVRSETVIKKVLSWTTSPEGTGKFPKLCKEAEMAARMALVIKRSNSKSPIPKEVAAHYLKMMQDENQSRSMRLFIVGYLLDKTKTPKPDDAMMVAAVNLLTESLEGDTPVLDLLTNMVLTSWLERKEIPKWSDYSDKLATAYQVRSFSGRAPERLKGRPDDDTILLVAALHFGNGNKGSAHQLLTKAENSFSDFTRPVLLLVREGEYSAAARILRKFTDKVGGSYGKNVWDEKFNTHAGPFADSIERPSMKLFAEALLAKIPDSKSSADRNQRIKMAAEKFVSTEIENQLMKEQLLYWFSRETASRKVIIESLGEAVAEIKLGLLFDSRSSRTKKLALINALQKERLQEGKTESYAALLEEVASIIPQSTYERDRFVKDLAHLPSKQAYDKKYDKQVVRQLLPAWQAILTKAKLTKQTMEGEHYMGHVVFAFTQSGQLDQLFEWINKQTDPALKKQIVGHFPNCSDTLMADAIKFLKKKPERSDFLEKLAGDPNWINGNYPVSYSFFRSAVKKRLFSRDEILAKGPKMAEKSPRLGYAWMELAALQEDKGNWKEALPYWERAILAAKEGEKTHNRKAEIAGTAFQVRQVDALLKLKLTDEAKEAFSKIDSTNVMNHNRKKYEEQKKNLNKNKSSK